MNLDFLPRFRPLGDSAILISLGETISAETSDLVLGLSELVREKKIEGVTDCIPAYATVLIKYDPLRVDYETLSGVIQPMLTRKKNAGRSAGRITEIPVYYGGKYGPDLTEVVRHTGLSPEEVIRLHSGAEYAVCFIGFLPGFPYLSGMDSRLATPRLATPRQLVPAGSVGIAGSQTGIYPLDSPGGWQIIGQSFLAIFDPKREPPALLMAGDRVRFIPAIGGIK